MVTRMSNNMITYNYLSGLNKALYKQTKALSQVLDGKLTRPSDNPVDTVLDMRYKVNLSTNEQYTKNTDTALSWMNTTHDSMSELDEILQQVRDLVVRAAEPNPQVAYDAVAAEIDELLQQAIQIGNTTLGDRYIFAGQADRGQAPFSLVSAGGTLPDGTTATVDTVVYSGDDNKISMVVNPGSPNPSVDGVNLTGNEVFNNCKFFEDLILIRDTLLAGGDPVPFLSEDALGRLDEHHDSLLTKQARLSAKVSAYEFGQNLLELANIRITENISKVEDVDIGEATMAFTNAQNAYNAALAVGAKILPMSLVDFLR